MDKLTEMKIDVLYILAFILFIGWFVGYIFYNIGGVFHLTFLLSILVLIVKLLKDNSTNNN